MLKNISYEKAAALIAAQEVYLRTEEVNLYDALDRVVAADVYAAFPMI